MMLDGRRVITVEDMQNEPDDRVIPGSVCEYLDIAWQRCWGAFECEGQDWAPDSFMYPGKQ